MAGGIFGAMNKIRPGAYINFTKESEEIANVGTRGIVTMLAPLSWGNFSAINEVTGADMINGKSLAKIGMLSTDANALLFNLALENAAVLKIFNTNKSGVKATKTLTDGLTITAKYPGVFGNKIAIVVKELNATTFDVETYADGYYVDSQKVAAIADLVSNDYVDFSGTGDLAATESTLLTGGTDGTAMQSSEYLPLYFTALKNTRWNTLAFDSNVAADITSIITFIQTMRETEGKYVQAVVANAAAANYEGIINLVNGVVLDNGTTVAAKDFTTWVAGATAGAALNESLTGKVVTRAKSVDGLLDNTAIINGLQVGKFILSLNQNGTVKVEKDINSLHSFTATKSYVFSKNRVIRELDTIGAAIEDIWETTYLGKVTNNNNGRLQFKSSIINYLADLVNQGAIDEFDPDRVIVEAGEDVDEVIASIAVKPLDSMEYLYMTVNIS